MTVGAVSGPLPNHPIPGLDLTRGHLLGGRVRYTQPAHGFRSGIEPVLLAAAVPARPGERVLEAGSGAGAALLCLAARIPGASGLGVERDPALAALAAENATANGAVRIGFLAAALEVAALPAAFDHAMANPPYHPAGGTASPDRAREDAKRGSSDLLATWTLVLGRALRRRGTLTFILSAALLPDCLRAMHAARCPAVRILPLWPKAGRPAKLVLVAGRKCSNAPLRLLPGMVLHQPDGRFTAEADAILRDGAAVDWG